MLDLANVLELVVDALHERPFAQQQLVGVRQQPLAHVLAHFGDQSQRLSGKELLGQRLGDVAPVAEELAKQTAHQAGDGTAIIDVARRQTEGQQVATIVDR